jgi:hypothetical protein
VVGAGDLFAGGFVQAVGEPFRKSTTVDENQGRSVCADGRDQCGVKGGPQRRPRFRGDDGSGLQSIRDGGAQVFKRGFDAEIEGATASRVDDRDGTRNRRSVDGTVRTREEAGDGFKRLLRRGESDALRSRTPDPQHFETFEREEKMGPALRSRERVDFIDDDRVDVEQFLPERPTSRGDGAIRAS